MSLGGGSVVASATVLCSLDGTLLSLCPATVEAAVEAHHRYLAGWVTHAVHALTYLRVSEWTCAWHVPRMRTPVQVCVWAALARI